jgi:hypothetical protein
MTTHFPNFDVRTSAFFLQEALPYTPPEKPNGMGAEERIRPVGLTELDKKKEQLASAANARFKIAQNQYGIEVNFIRDRENSLIGGENRSLSWEKRKLEIRVTTERMQREITFRIGELEHQYKINVAAITKETARLMAIANERFKAAEIRHENEIRNLTEQFRLEEVDLVRKTKAIEGQFRSIAWPPLKPGR